jgi:hypothetical protein
MSYFAEFPLQIYSYMARSLAYSLTLSASREPLGRGGLFWDFTLSMRMVTR